MPRRSGRSYWGNLRIEKSLAEKTVEDILRHFGDTVKVARGRYREFVKKGIAPKGAARNFREVGWSGALEGIKQTSLAEKRKTVKREMRGYWAVGISFMQLCTNLRN